MMTQIIVIILQAALAFFISTLLFDAFHYFSHRCLHSKIRLLRRIGLMHLTHHRFYTSSLQINKSLTRKNFLHHVLTEYFVHLGGIALCLFIFNPIAIALACLLETVIFLTVCYYKGIDAHHKPYKHLPSYRKEWFVTSEYHALHHLHPTKYFGSYLTLFDRLFGTAYHFHDKHITITGAGGALGSNMKKLLEKEGAKITVLKYGVDYHYNNYDNIETILENTDILLLCHGSKLIDAEKANCDSFVSLIELFKKVRKKALMPPEVWAAGSEIECHPCFGIKNIKIYAASKRHFARHAWRYYRDPTIQYRHLVHSAFISPMGPGLMTASFAARVTLFLLKRGFRYVPVTYTGFAWINYLRFVFQK